MKKTKQSNAVIEILRLMRPYVIRRTKSRFETMKNISFEPGELGEKVNIPKIKYE